MAELLTKRGYETLIVITSDDGEYLGEHDFLGHSKDVYDTVLNIPLLLKAPGQQSKKFDEPFISHVHIPGLVFEHTKLHESKIVEPFMSHWPRTNILAENDYSRTKDVTGQRSDRFQRVRTAVYTESVKYIHSSDDQHELYVAGDDPKELKKLYLERPRNAEKSEKLRDRLMPDSRRGEPMIREEVLSSEEKQALFDLGHLAAEPVGDPEE